MVKEIRKRILYESVINQRREKRLKKFDAKGVVLEKNEIVFIYSNGRECYYCGNSVEVSVGW